MGRRERETEYMRIEYFAEESPSLNSRGIGGFATGRETKQHTYLCCSRRVGEPGDPASENFNRFSHVGEIALALLRASTS